MLQRMVYGLYTWMAFVPLNILSTLFFGLLCLIIVGFVGPRRSDQICAVPWARFGLLLSGLSVSVSGQKNIDPAKSYLIVANHLSLYDIWVIYGYLGMDIRWVAKKELRAVPVVGIACEKLGHVFIDRSDHEKALQSLEAAKHRILPVTSIIFFPEGSRSKTGQLKRFKKGAFRMALDLRLPMLPITLQGTREALPPGSAVINTGHAHISIHEPIGVTDADIEALVQKSRDAIAGRRQASNEFINATSRPSG